jgi:hypothetical protein
VLAKFVGFATCVGANPDLVEHASPSAAKQYRLGARTNNGAQTFHRLRIHNERLIATKTSGDLNTPQLHHGTCHTLFKPGDKAIGRTVEQRDQLAAAGVLPTVGHRAILARPNPVFNADTSNREDVIACFQRHAPEPASQFCTRRGPAL